MKFIDKLIEETKSGQLDFIWQFYNNDRFKYRADKHPLTDLNFSLSDIVNKEITTDSGKKKSVPDNTKGEIIFPNGAGLIVDRKSLETLYQECVNAIFRAMTELATSYATGNIQKELEEAEKEKLKKENPADEKPANKNKIPSVESPE